MELSLPTALSTWHKEQITCEKKVGFADLCDDVVLEIYMYLDVTDTLALLTVRSLHRDVAGY